MENLIYGIVNGSIILLGAVGFSMIQMTQRFVHIAHGQFLLLGAYLAYFFNVILGLNIVIAALFSIIICMLVGVIVYNTLFYPIRKSRGDILLFTSIGLAYLIQGVVAAISGTKLLSYNVPASRVIEVAGHKLFTKYELIVIICGVVAVVLIHFFLTRTTKGKMTRAMANNYDLARIRGVSTKSISNVIWMIASGMGALAGILVGVIGSLDTGMGWIKIMIILSATVLGGLGSIYGVMIASLLLGVSMDLGVLVISPNYRTAIAFAIIVIVLLIFPKGLREIPVIIRSKREQQRTAKSGAAMVKE